MSDVIQREFTLAVIRDRMFRINKMPDVILSDLEKDLIQDINSLLGINDERKAENEQLQTALKSIVHYGSSGAGDGTTYSADCDAMRQIARDSLEVQAS